jgi:hypothetical protein
MAYLFDIPNDCGRSFYQDICRRNYELNQVKLSIDSSNRLWISYEIPNRILDWNELSSDIDTIACWYEDNYNNLKAAMNKWWDYDREARSSSMNVSLTPQSNYDKEAMAHIAATSKIEGVPMSGQSPAQPTKPVSDEEVTRHIMETTPPMEPPVVSYEPPARQTMNNAAPQPSRPKVAKVQKMTPQVVAGNAPAKQAMETVKQPARGEEVAGIKQWANSPKNVRHSTPVHNLASPSRLQSRYAPNAVSATMKPACNLSPLAPAQMKGHWTASRSGTTPGTTEKVAGWSNRTTQIYGCNPIDRSVPKFMTVYSYEQKMIMR